MVELLKSENGKLQPAELQNIASTGNSSTITASAPALSTEPVSEPSNTTVARVSNVDDNLSTIDVPSPPITLLSFPTKSLQSENENLKQYGLQLKSQQEQLLLVNEKLLAELERMKNENVSL